MLLALGAKTVTALEGDLPERALDSAQATVRGNIQGLVTGRTVEEQLLNPLAHKHLQGNTLALHSHRIHGLLHVSHAWI